MWKKTALATGHLERVNIRMDTTKKTALKVSPEQLEKLVDFIRRSGRPQSLESLTRRYIELVKEKEGSGSR